MFMQTLHTLIVNRQLLPKNDNKKAANIGNAKTLDLWIKKSLLFQNQEDR